MHERAQWIQWLERFQTPVIPTAEGFVFQLVQRACPGPWEVYSDLEVDALSRYTLFLHTSLTTTQVREMLKPTPPLIDLPLHTGLVSIPMHRNQWLLMQDYVRRLQNLFSTRPPSAFTVVAYSIGAGPGLLTAMAVRELHRTIPVQIVSFGGCKVGGNRLAEIFQRQDIVHHRVVLPDDPVPDMLPLPYIHFGTLWILHPPDDTRFVRETTDEVHSVTEYLERLRRGAGDLPRP